MKKEKFPHTRKGSLLTGRDGGSFGATEESATMGVWRAKYRESHTEDQCQPAVPSLKRLPACWGGWGMGAEARASEVIPQGKDWGWLHEDSLRGLVLHS